MADYETQIVVIAGGPSGLSAAVQAAEDGAEVIVVEKQQQSAEQQTWEWDRSESEPNTRNRT